MINHQKLYQEAPCGNICCKPSGEIIEVNHYFLALVGHERKDVLHKMNLSDLLTKEGQNHYKGSYLKTLKLHGFVNGLSMNLQNKELELVPVLINSIEVNDPDGNCMYIQSTVIDITRRKKLENKLSQAKKNAEDLSGQLQGLNKELDSFAYIAIHDLKSPILDVIGHFDFLKTKFSTQDITTNESVRFVEQGLEQFKSTLDSLTNVIKIKKIKPTLEPVDIAVLTRELLPYFQTKAASIGGSITLQTEHSVWVLGNYSFVKSILENIVGNAIKYHSPERQLQVMIDIKVFNYSVVLSIIDNGIGIDLESNGDHLFGIFKRFSTHTEGSGIGLYMVSQMLRQIKGEVVVESKLGEGSKFIVNFKNFRPLL